MRLGLLLSIALWSRTVEAAESLYRCSADIDDAIGSTSVLGIWGGLPLYLTQGPSADLTAMPVVYGSGLARFDLQQRINTTTTQADIRGTLDSTGRGGLMIDASQQLSPLYDVSLNLDWAGETEQGALRLLDQTTLDHHSNQLSLEAAKGHSFAALAFNQDVILAPDATGTVLDWAENWVPRADTSPRRSVKMTRGARTCCSISQPKNSAIWRLSGRSLRC